MNKKLAAAILSASLYFFSPSPALSTVPAHPSGLEKIVEKQPSEKCPPLDILFLVDITSSMYDDIASVKKEISETMKKLAGYPAQIRYALSIVGDFPTIRYSNDIPYLLISNFNDDHNEILRKLNSLEPYGGGDRPEAYAYALGKAVQEKWNPQAQKIVVIFADDKDHDEKELAAVIKNAPYKLYSATSDQVAAYWQKYSPNVILGKRTLMDKLSPLVEKCKSQQDSVCVK